MRFLRGLATALFVTTLPMAATARGEGFMSYAVAEARLRKALIPYLVGGRTIGPVQSLFEQIFDR